MQHRFQRTIRRAVEVSGIGLFTGTDVTLRFLPAGPDHGVAFQRIDCAGSKPIPARLEFAVPRQRRTSIANDGVVIEMTEHVLAALAGLRIDNCVVQLDAAEPPGCDGSALCFADALLAAGIEQQDAPRSILRVEREFRVSAEDGQGEITAEPAGGDFLRISYHLDYGPDLPIPQQELTVQIDPETFLADVAFARTFVLESEVEALRHQGYGRRTTFQDLLVFGEHGVIDNELRASDECVRHKILDCLGDFALTGCDVYGHFRARRSGHRLNREIARQIQVADDGPSTSARRHAA